MPFPTIHTNQNIILVWDVNLDKKSDSNLSLSKSISQFQHRLSVHRSITNRTRFISIGYNQNVISVETYQYLNELEVKALKKPPRGGCLHAMDSALEIANRLQGKSWIVLIHPGKIESHSPATADLVKAVEISMNTMKHQSIHLGVNAINSSELHCLVPLSERPWLLKDHRYNEFFYWLQDSLEFYRNCQDDLPFTTTYSWAHIFNRSFR